MQEIQLDFADSTAVGNGPNPNLTMIRSTGELVRMLTPARRESTRAEYSDSSSEISGMIRTPASKEVQPDFVAPNSRVVADHFVHEGRQFAENLHANQPTSNHHERQLAATNVRVGFNLRPLHSLDHMVAQQNGIGQRLKREG
jgi:hypothetical protein